MKKSFFITCAASIILTGCSSKELSRDEAFKMIKQNNQFPKLIDYDVYSSDPAVAKEAVDAGLEKEGLVTVQRTQKLGDVGKPLIQFTSKAQPFLLATPEKDRAIYVQKVKLADEDLVEVRGIKTKEDGKQAVAEYTTAYKNVSGFSALTKVNFNQLATRKANFALYEDGWRLEQKK